MCWSLSRTQSTDETMPKRRDTVGSLSRWGTMYVLLECMWRFSEIGEHCDTRRFAGRLEEREEGETVSSDDEKKVKL